MQERLDGRAASKVGAFGAIHGHFRVSRGLWRRNRLRNEQAFQARRQWNTCLYSLSFVIGALLITFAVIAMAESARMVRFLMIPVAAALLITPFVYGVGTTSTVLSLIIAVAVTALAVRRGSVKGRYGTWSRYLV